MQYVTVVFANGNIVHFAAQEFDADLSHNLGYVNKYPYKDAQGQDSFIHLKPHAVTGIFLTQSPGAGESAITYRVAGGAS